MARVFFSYSHRDEAMRDELEVHLSSLKRQKLIQTWHDRRIGVGHEFEGAIDRHLEVADVILLLVSPYFIASDYCYDVEIKRALERHADGTARVVPIILHPCDWHDLQFGKLLATPTDGRPVSKFANQHEGFLEVVQAIKGAVKDIVGSSSEELLQESVADEGIALPRISDVVRSSNLRIRKEFTDNERDQFADESFEYISRYFEGSLTELKKRNSNIDFRFKQNDASSFTTIIYSLGSTVCECRVSLGQFWGKSLSIVYSNDASNRDSFNESLSVDDDGFTLFLKSSGFSGFGRGNHGGDDKLSQEGAAELFWSLLIERIQ